MKKKKWKRQKHKFYNEKQQKNAKEVHESIM